MNKRLYQATIILALAPMLIGASTFLIWLVTRDDSLIDFGIYGTFGCIASIIASFVCLVTFLWKERVKKSMLILPALGAIALILINFPIGSFVVKTAIYMTTQYVLIIENVSQQPVKDIEITTANFKDTIPELTPGQKVEKKYHFSADGALSFKARIKGQSTVGVLEGYVCGGLGGEKHLLFTDEEPYRIEKVNKLD